MRAPTFVGALCRVSGSEPDSRLQDADAAVAAVAPGPHAELALAELARRAGDVGIARTLAHGAAAVHVASGVRAVGGFGRRQRSCDDSAGGARGSEQCGGGPT